MLMVCKCSPSSSSLLLRRLKLELTRTTTTVSSSTWLRGRTTWRTPHSQAQSSPNQTAVDVVRNFYAGINARDLSSVQHLISPTCVYEDLVFPHPFRGREAILDFFGKFMDSISTDLQFVIDDISEEDTVAVGVSWHLEWKGKPFPFSKGCSFYRLDVVNGKRQIICRPLFGQAFSREGKEVFASPSSTSVGLQHSQMLLNVLELHPQHYHQGTQHRA